VPDYDAVAPDSPPPDPAAFAVHRSRVRDRLELAYLREGTGGAPLLLLHGYPETKRIWWRNVAPLAAAGFEVVVPDLRGHGDSDLAPDDHYDVAAFALDVHGLMTEVLGHDRYAVVGGDVGGVVAYDLGVRYPAVVERAAIFNTVAPLLDDAYAAAGIPPEPARHERPTADYFVRQGTDADGLLAELDTPDRRRAYVAAMYTHRLWAAPGHFTAADVAFHAEPYADAARLRASWGVYETATGRREMEDVPRLLEPTDTPTLVLYGTADHVVDATFPDRMAVACRTCIGPFHVPGAGHFVQWEAAALLNTAIAHFLGPRPGC